MPAAARSLDDNAQRAVFAELRIDVVHEGLERYPRGMPVPS
jgi:hypothetical protein